MKLICKALFFTLTTGLLQANLSANARPYAYTTGGSLFSGTSECVREGKQIARSAGFKVNEVVFDDNPENGATIFGKHTSRDATFAFRCETAYGIYSYATSSLDNDTAFEVYRDVIQYDPSQI